jgi:hypothetical protein
LAWDNYLNIDDLKFDQQFLPEVYEKEIERFGNRTISGFLRMVGAEMPMASDVVTWVEQGRLHIAYDSLVIATGQTPVVNTISGLPTGHLIGTGMTIAVSNATGSEVDKAYVTAVAANSITVACYGQSADGGLSITPSAGTDKKLFVYGSEYGKGSSGVGNQIEASSSFFSNKPIILRDKYSVYGSNVAQIGWVEVTTEAGTGGYLWYLKSEHESRLRFQDYLEMSMVEAEKSQNAAGTADRDITPVGLGTNTNGVIHGTEGLFAAIEDRGNVFTGLDTGTGSYGTIGGDGAAAQTYINNNGIGEFDTILQQLDTQGAIEENMLFLDRATALGFDNMLAALNAPYGGGTSYGVFENSEDMALNLGFNGFRRGSYDFYKTDWKYLNDSTTRGIIDDIEGVLVPAGVSTVYDQQLGTNIQRPFLHVRYRASEADDRRMKSWITGSVGGNYTSDEDAMNVHFLSERALCVQGANNFVLFKAV